MTIKTGVTIEGADELKEKLEGLDEYAMEVSLRTLTKITTGIHGETKKLIASMSAGERVTRYDPKREHTVSKEGDAPNSDTGRLLNSYMFEIDPKNLKSAVGSNLSYSVDLEFGTSKMGARPHLGPVVLNYKKKIAIEFLNEWKATVRILED